MMNIPDAPWVQDPERYASDYYGGCYEGEDEYYHPERYEEEDEDDE